MVIKGGSRSGPGQLARHLSRTDTNGRVEILELHSPHGNLTETFRDWQMLADGTRGTLGLYHANIDPHAGYTMTPEQWMRAVEVLEQKLGFEGQPRTVVLHEKHGREHIHVVWQRTDVDTMTLKSDSWNYIAHEEASLALEKEFGHEHVPGKHAKRDRQKQPEFPRQAFNHAEWQQGERTGIDPRAFKAAITQLYEQSDNGQALKAALEEQGYVLAKGRRDFLIVDQQRQVYNLARQIKGMTEKDLREFMADIDRETIPTVDQAKDQAKALQQERAQKTPEPPKEEVNEEIEALKKALSERQAAETKNMQLRQEQESKQTASVLDGEMKEKLAHFDALQKAAKVRFYRETFQAKTGIAGIIDTIRYRLNPEAAAEVARQRQEAQAAFVRAQEKERAERIDELNADRSRDMADLTERHEQQRREHSAKSEQELARYLRERESAQRLLAEIEERRRQQELESEQQRTRDGPPPPTRAR